MSKIKLIATIILSFVAMNLFGQDQNDQNAKLIAKLVDAGSLKIEITKIKPMAMPSKTTRFEYDITLKRDAITTELPYLGKSTQPSVGMRDLMIEMTDQKVDIQKKYNEKRKKHELKFRAKDDNSHSSCDFFIEIFENGLCYIRVSLTGRDPISYEGELKMVEIKTIG